MLKIPRNELPQSLEKIMNNWKLYRMFLLLLWGKNEGKIEGKIESIPRIDSWKSCYDLNHHKNMDDFHFFGFAVFF